MKEEMSHLKEFQITYDWKSLTKLVWKLELWYTDNYRKLPNKKRSEIRKFLDKQTALAYLSKRRVK